VGGGGVHALRALRVPDVGRAARGRAGDRAMSAVAAEPRPFDIRGELPTGVTVLEASAGTGKTFPIAALAARYVAEGTPLERLLLVTFTRMATGELRERVRERLARDLAAETDVTRCERLARAVSDFDAATIATTHGFCQEVLSGLGGAGDADAAAGFAQGVA